MERTLLNWQVDRRVALHILPASLGGSRGDLTIFPYSKGGIPFGTHGRIDGSEHGKCG